MWHILKVKTISGYYINGVSQFTAKIFFFWLAMEQEIEQLRSLVGDLFSKLEVSESMKLHIMQ